MFYSHNFLYSDIRCTKWRRERAERSNWKKRNWERVERKKVASKKNPFRKCLKNATWEKMMYDSNAKRILSRLVITCETTIHITSVNSEMVSRRKQQYHNFGFYLNSFAMGERNKKCAQQMENFCLSKYFSGYCFHSFDCIWFCVIYAPWTKKNYNRLHTYECKTTKQSIKSGHIVYSKKMACSIVYSVWRGRKMHYTFYSFAIKLWRNLKS